VHVLDGGEATEDLHVVFSADVCLWIPGLVYARVAGLLYQSMSLLQGRLRAVDLDGLSCGPSYYVDIERSLNMGSPRERLEG